MAGSTTRFGFASGAGGDAEDEARAATTLYGRDLHLDRAALTGLGVRRGEPSSAPEVAAPPATQTAEVLAGDQPVFTPPEHTGKSRFPALARLFGRWNTGGDLVGHAESDSLFEIPRPRYLRPLGLLAVAALVSFLVVVLIIRFGHHPAPPVQPTPQLQPLAAPPVRPVAPASVAAPQPAPAVVPQAPPAAPPAQPIAVPPEARPTLKAAEAPRPAVRRSTRRRGPSSDPDSLLPLSF